MVVKAENEADVNENLYSTLNEISQESKEIQRLLNFERFGLLDDDTQAAVDSERKNGRIPLPLKPISQEEFNGIKSFYGSFIGKRYAENDFDFAKIHFATEKAGNFFTNKDVQKEIAAIAGGIILPTFLPYVGPATLPARIAAFVAKYPRYSKTFAAFVGGAGGASAFSDDYLEALGYGAREAAGEGAFQIFHKFFPSLRKIFQGDKGKSIEDNASIALKVAQEAGTTITPAKLSSSRTIDLLEQIANISLVGGAKMQRQGIQTQEKIIESMLKYLSKEFTEDGVLKGSDEFTANMVRNFMKQATQENVDDLIKNFLLKGADFYDEAIEASYKNVGKTVRKIAGISKVIDISDLKTVLQNQKKTFFGKGTGNRPIEVNDVNLNALEKYIKSLPDKVDIVTANKIRSKLLGDTGIYTTGVAQSNQAKAISGAMFDAMNKNIDNSMQNLINSGKYSKEQIKLIKDAYTEAATLFKQGKESFNADFVTTLLTAESSGFTKKGLDISDAFYKNFVQAGKPARIDAFYKLIDDAVAKKVLTKEGGELISKKIQGNFISNVLSNNTDATTGFINAKNVLNDISNFRGKGKNIMPALFRGRDGALALTNFENYLKALNVAQQKGIETGAGTLFLQAGQFGSALGFLTLGGGDPGTVATSALILGGPAVISRAFTNPKFVNSLMNLKFAQSAGEGKFSGLVQRSLLNIMEEGVKEGYFEPFQAKNVATELNVEGLISETDLEGLSFMDAQPNKLDSEIDQDKKDSTEELLNSIQNDTTTTGDEESLIEINLDDTTTLPDPSSSLVTDIIQPVSALPTTQSTPGPVGSGINPQTQQRLESVGLPLFAAQGGIASLMSRKKPKQMVV